MINGLVSVSILEGRKFFDRLANKKIYIADYPASISFPAPYAIYAFNSHDRSIRESSLQRRGSQIRDDFIVVEIP